jgi:hypothetical protein
VIVFQVFANNGAGWAKLIFCSLVDIMRLGSEETEANSAVSTYCMDVYALYRRFFQYAIRGTVAAGNTYFWVDLPDGISGVGLSAQEDGGSAKAG